MLNLFSVSAPTCKQPEHGLFATREGNNFEYPYLSNVIYKCNSGFILEEGDLVRTCQENGEWDGDPPLCVGMYKLHSTGVVMAIYYLNMMVVHKYILLEIGIGIVHM